MQRRPKSCNWNCGWQYAALSRIIPSAPKTMKGATSQSLKLSYLVGSSQTRRRRLALSMHLSNSPHLPGNQGETASRSVLNRRAAASIICDRLPFPDCSAILRCADHLGAPTSASGWPVSPSVAENVSWLCSVSSSSRVAIDDHGTRADAATILRTGEIRVVPRQPEHRRCRVDLEFNARLVPVEENRCRHPGLRAIAQTITVDANQLGGDRL